MAFKLAVLYCSLALVHGSVVPSAVGTYAAAYGVPVAARLEDCDPLPQYKFGYDVTDTLTGDYKSQVEQRDGDLVQGQYSLVESDGTLRIVQYTADSVNGFNAIVRNEPLVAASSLPADPAVVPTRITAAAPVISQPAVTSSVFARYTIPSKVVASPTAVVPVSAAAPVYPSLANTYSALTAPVAAPYTTYGAAPYTAPYLATAYTATYAAPYASAYSAPVGPAYSNLVASSLPGPVVGVFPEVAAPSAITAVQAAPAKLVEPVVAAGCS